MFELITTFYSESDLERRNELLTTLRKNTENEFISAIHIICESGQEFLKEFDSKIRIIDSIERPKFNDLIRFSNSLCSTNIKIIANTDIYFNNTIFDTRSIGLNEVYCLTRWDYRENNELEFYANFKSQDAWIFRGMLPEEIGYYFMGIPGCDNRLAFELKNCGFRLKNPSFSIQAVHLHSSQLRNYNKRLDKVQGHYYYPLPESLFQISNKEFRLKYLQIRRKFYNSICQRTLEGVTFETRDITIARLCLIYYKIRIRLTRLR